MQCFHISLPTWRRTLVLYLFIHGFVSLHIPHNNLKQRTLNVNTTSHRKTRDNRSLSINHSEIIEKRDYTKQISGLVEHRHRRNQKLTNRQGVIINLNYDNKNIDKKKSYQKNVKYKKDRLTNNTEIVNILSNGTERGKRKADTPIGNSFLGLHNQRTPIENTVLGLHTQRTEPFNENMNNFRRHDIPETQLDPNIAGHSFLRQRLLNALARRMQERNMIIHHPELLRDRNMMESTPHQMYNHDPPQMLLDQQTPFPEPPSQRSPHIPLGSYPMDHAMAPYPVDHAMAPYPVDQAIAPYSVEHATANNRMMNGNTEGDGSQTISADNGGYPESGRFPDTADSAQYSNVPNRENFPDIAERDRFSDVSDRGRFAEVAMPPQRMFGSTVGNLGDEILPPFGSLGDSKPDYIPLGRLGGDDTVANMFPPTNQMIGGDDIADFVPNERPLRHHKKHRGGKKTWITDVNIYSKKKGGDGLNQLMNEDDDPNDEIDPCDPSPCHHAGICKILGSIDHVCVCPRTHKGKNCERRNRCHPNPCRNRGKCSETVHGFQCSCGVGFKGERCQERNYCLPNPCQNAGFCTESITSNDHFSCSCVEGFFGNTCEEQHSLCHPNPCQNHAHCVSDGTSSFQCVCHKGTTGKLCQEGQLDTDNSLESIASIFHVGEHTENAEEKSVIRRPPKLDSLSTVICDTTPCLNGGICHSDSTTQRGYICECGDLFSGSNCEDKKCKCENGGTCIGEGVEVKCICKAGYAGSTCQEHTQCNEDTCMHGGICIEQVGGFRCKCDKGYKGQRCEEFDKCVPNPCLHGGQCKDYGDFYKCDCKRGFKGRQCEDVDFCEPNPCQNNAQCFGYIGGFQCECQSGFTGKLCDQKLHCLSNPCSNGAQCIEVLPTPEHPDSSYKCGCKPGYTGDSCDTKDYCESFPCKNGGTCTNSKDDYICSCTDKFRGKQCEAINHCFDNPCQNNGQCTSLIHDFKCGCTVGFKGLLCDQIDYCQPNPCKNSGFCSSNPAGNGFICKCSEGYKGINCEDIDPCFPNPCVHGQCSDVAGGYLCNCTVGFKGPQCSDIDHCNPNPCFHGGSCIEIKGGVGYLCNCPEGYKGQMCEEKDFCHPNPCHHNGICKEATQSHMMYTNQTERIECTCEKGYRGTHCEDLDQCFPNPCLHESLCIAEGKTATKCNCSLGWKGEHCELADLCAPDPCRYGTHCIQTDAESYECIKNLCTPSPCGNGGKCIVVNDESFECACPRGWRGKKCLEQDLCVPNPCFNSGVCHDITDNVGFRCECPKNFSGPKCDVHQKRNEVTNICSTSPCKNGGHCIQTTDGKFTCRCLDGFSGPLCDDNVCNPMPCQNGGTCVPYYGIALCKCVHGYTGAHCSDMKRTLSAITSFLLHHDVIDQTGTVKSITPHPNSIKKADTLALAERVEEILNSDRDIKNSESDDLLQDITQKITPNTKANDILPPPPNVHNRIEQYTGINPSKDPTTPNDVFPNVEQNILSTKQDSKEISYVKPAPPVHFPSTDALNASPQAPQAPQTPQVNQGGLPQASLAQQPPKPLLPLLATQSDSVPPIPPAAQPMSMYPQQSTLNHPVDQSPPLQRPDTPANPDLDHETQLPPPPPIVPPSDPCQPNICLHDGVCVVRSNGDPECICKEGYSGSRCEYLGLTGYSSAPKFFPKDECSHCDANAICVNGHCICNGKYVGDGLECWLSTAFDKDWTCLVNPCQNGGTCKPGRAKCVCRLGYIGTYCETYCPPAVHLSFQGVKKQPVGDAFIKDESGNNNFATLTNGAFIVPDGGKCDAAASLNGGDILFDGESFYPKPYQSVTISVWVKLDTDRGIQSIFDTVGGVRSTHREGQYHLEIDNGRVRWFHRNEAHVTIFSVLTPPMVAPGNWTHITGTYNGVLGVAKLFINGDVAGMDSQTSSARYLSQDWQGKAGIGKHQHTFGNRLLRGMVDEFYIFACPLPRLEILVLMHHCKIYWKNNRNSKNTDPARKPADPSKSTRINTNQHEANFQALKVVPAEISASNNFQKSKDQFQNNLGFTSGNPKDLKMKLEKANAVTPHSEKLQQNLLTVSGIGRQNIKRPTVIQQPLDIFHQPGVDAHHFVPVDDNNFMMNTIPGYTSQKTAELMPIKLNGPSAFFTETGPSTENQGMKRTNILTSDTQYAINPFLIDQFGNHYVNDGSQSPSLEQSDNSHEKYFNIPRTGGQVRAVKVLGPSEFLNQLVPPARAPPPTMFLKNQNDHHVGDPRTQNNHQVRDPRWFTWQKGLAQVNGGTYTNTHSNTLQRNDPGTANADTHVQSSQNAKGGTKIKSRTSMSGPPRASRPPQSFIQRQPPPQQQRPLPLQKNSIQHNIPPPRLQKPFIQRAPLVRKANLHPNNLPPQQFIPRQVQTTTHTHQWGFGNGNGNGQGVGTPSASGSGGGWGAGGPLSQQANLPGWGGNPPNGPPWGNPQDQQQQQQRNMMNILPHQQAPVDPHSQLRPSKIQQSRPVSRNFDGRLPSNARLVWNAYIAQAAQKKQSTSDMHTDATNIAESSVKINPQNGGQNMQVAGHNWGFGNGNGEGQGQGSPGGQGQGGGWGAGGPTKQNTWLPGQQQQQPQQQRRMSPPHNPLNFKTSGSKFMIVQARRSQIPSFSSPYDQSVFYNPSDFTFNQGTKSFQSETPQYTANQNYRRQEISPQFYMSNNISPQQENIPPIAYNMNPRKTFVNTELRILSNSQSALTPPAIGHYDKRKRKKRKRRRSVER